MTAAASSAGSTDDGAGIPDGLIDRVFDKGETDSESGGAGLGLTIVKTLTEAHGGTVDRREPGRARRDLPLFAAGPVRERGRPGPVSRSTPRPPETSTAAR